MRAPFSNYCGCVTLLVRLLPSGDIVRAGGEACVYVSAHVRVSVCEEWGGVGRSEWVWVCCVWMWCLCGWCGWVGGLHQNEAVSVPITTARRVYCTETTCQSADRQQRASPKPRVCADAAWRCVIQQLHRWASENQIRTLCTYLFIYLFIYLNTAFKFGCV